MKRKGPSAAQRNFIFSELGYCSCGSQQCKEKAAALRACESQKSSSSCCVHSRASPKPEPGFLAYPSSPGPVVSAWGSTAWGGTYVRCVLSEALGDWNEPRISSFLFFFFPLQVYPQQSHGWYLALSHFSLLYRSLATERLCKETRCWDEEWVGILPLARYRVTKYISFIITFSTLLIEKLDNDDT